MEIRTSRSPRSALATIEFSSTDMENHTVEVNTSKFQGVKNNLFFVVTSGTDVYVDSWQFTEAGSSGIQNIQSQTSNAKSEVYDLFGRRLSDTNNYRGIVIEQYTDENGVKHSRKRY